MPVDVIVSGTSTLPSRVNEPSLPCTRSIIIRDPSKANANGLPDGLLHVARKKAISYCVDLVKKDFQAYRSRPQNTFPNIVRNKANVQQVCVPPRTHYLNAHILIRNV